MNDYDSTLSAEIKNNVLFVSDFPYIGFNFPDITPIIENNPTLFARIIDKIAKSASEYDYNVVLCIESFGYAFGIPLAHQKHCNVALMRKSGKLPRPVVSHSYSMCYDADRTMEVNRTAISPGDRVIILDDFLASGGTAGAAIEIVQSLNGIVAAVVCIIEIPSLNGRSALSKYNAPILTLSTIEL